MDAYFTSLDPQKNYQILSTANNGKFPLSNIVGWVEGSLLFSLVEVASLEVCTPGKVEACFMGIKTTFHFPNTSTKMTFFNQITNPHRS